MSRRPTVGCPQLQKNAVQRFFDLPSSVFLNPFYRFLDYAHVRLTVMPNYNQA